VNFEDRFLVASLGWDDMPTFDNGETARRLGGSDGFGKVAAESPHSTGSWRTADNGREVFDEVSARRLVPRINLDMKSDGVFFLFHQRHSIIGLKV
jgi:hypothetical protein